MSGRWQLRDEDAARLWEGGVQREQSQSQRSRAARRPKLAHGTRGRPGGPRSERRRDLPQPSRAPRASVRNLLDISRRRSSRDRHGARSCPIFGSSKPWSLCSTACRSSAPGARRAGANRNCTGWGEAGAGVRLRLSATYSSELQGAAAGGDRQLRVFDTLGGGQQAGEALNVRRRATQGNQLHAVVMVQMDMQYG